MVEWKRDLPSMKEIKKLCEPCDFFVPNEVCRQPQVEAKEVQVRRVWRKLCSEAEVNGKIGTMRVDGFIPSRRVI